MDVRLVAGTTWRYPEARALWTEKHGWTVSLTGTPEEVVARGVYKSDEVGNRPLRLRSTVHDAYLNLDRISQIEDDQDAVGELALHARQHAVSRLLCHHGRPMWHEGRKHKDRGCGQLLEERSACIPLRDVRRMMNGLRGIEDLAYHVATRRQPARPAQVEAALQWPLMPTYLDDTARIETQRDGSLFIGRCKQIVTMSLQQLQAESLLVYGIEWIKDQRMQLIAHAHTDLALYAYDFTARVLGAANPSDVDLTAVCQHCRQPFQPRVHPRPGSSYCQKSDCQRARKRNNQRSSRRQRQRMRATPDN